MSSSEELILDLEELKQLQRVAKRPLVLSIISSEIRNLEKLSSDAASAQLSQIPAPVSAAPVQAPLSNSSKIAQNSLINYSTLSSFSWDQDSDQLKIYISLEGVEKEKTETDFKPMSFDVKLHDVQGKNYRCAMPKLNKEIVPEKCKLIVKPKRVVITLFKASKGNWLDLQYKEDKLKPNMDKGRDPMAGIMDMMKNMYDDGDDEMKRTIAKAWTDSRSGSKGKHQKQGLNSASKPNEAVEIKLPSPSHCELIQRKNKRTRRRVEKRRAVAAENSSVTPPHHYYYGTFQGVANYQSQPALGFPQPAPHTGVSGASPQYHHHGYQVVPGYAVVEGRPFRKDRLPCCGMGLGWLLFISGFFLGAIPWYIGAFLLLCARLDYRENAGLIACTLAVLIIVVYDKNRLHRLSLEGPEVHTLIWSGGWNTDGNNSFFYCYF